MRSRFTEQKIIAILREQEAVVPTAEGLSQTRRQLGDALQMEGEVRRAGHLGSEAAEGAGGRENSRLNRMLAEALKRMLAEAMLDNAALKDLLGKSGEARRTTGGQRICVKPSR